MPVRRRRLLIRFVLIPVLGLLVVIATIPLWLPWVLRPAGRSAGLSFDRYERHGYSRFSLRNVTLTNDAMRVTAGSLNAFTPVAWIFNVLQRDTNQTYVQVEAWTFQSLPETSSTNDTKTVSVFTNAMRLDDVMELAATWLPNAILTNGAVWFGSNEVRVTRATLLGDDVSVQAVLPGNEVVDATFERRARGEFHLAAAAPELEARIDLGITNQANGLVAGGTAAWKRNPVELAAEFGRGDTLPRRASVVSEQFRLPGEVLQLPRYGEVAGRGRIVWNADGVSTNADFTPQFQVDLAANATTSDPTLPPFELQFRALGNTNRARVESAQLRMPWLEAQFSEGTDIQFEPPFLVEPAQLRVRADLARQEQLPASGVLQGAAELFPSTNRFPRVAFHLTGNDVSVSNLQMRAVQLEGEFEWPLVELRGTRVTLTDGSEAVVAGRVNVEEKTLEGGEFRTEGAFGRDLLPQGYEFESLSGQSQVSGALTNLQHSGSMTLKRLELPGAEPLDLQVDWTGRHDEVRSVVAQVRAGAGSLRLRGGVDRSNRVMRLTIDELHLQTSAHGMLTLDSPVSARLEQSGTASAPSWQIEVSPLRLAGSSNSIDLVAAAHWPRQGAITLAMTNISSSLLQDFLTFTNLQVLVDHVRVQSGWSNGPVSFDVTAAVHTTIPPGNEFGWQTRIHGGGGGVELRDFSVAASTQVLARASGALPVVINPSATNDWLRFLSDGPVRLNAFTETNSALWQELAAQLPIELTQPEVRADVTGTWARPSGTIRARVDRIEARLDKPLPVVTGLDLHVEMNEETARAQMRAAVEGQPIAAQARLPLGRGFWSSLRTDRTLPDWNDATGELSIRDAKLASFVPFAPELLAPQGEFSVSVRLEEGMRLTGEAILYNAGTRPLESIGPVRAIDAKIVFAGRDVTLTNFAAEIGGQRIRATGHALLADSVWQDRQLPEFDIRLTGSNIPLVRQASVLVRSDLDLVITNGTATNGFITGKVTLRESFFLSSLGDLAPGGVTSPRRRPPFFSLEKEPFASWRLGLNVVGDQFMRAQTPFFRGIASTTMRIEGTLREPLALGEVRINSGTVTFPFGSLAVKQGFVSLTSADPYHPQLFISAEAERMGYDIQMDVTGPADQPVVQFSSSPPLSSEQIVLMLTTGQTPAGVGSAASTRQRAQGMALFVGKNILSDLGFGGSGDGRLTIRSGEQVTDSGRPTYDVEYRLTDDWSVVGEYDRFSQYNLGFKWRVYSK